MQVESGYREYRPPPQLRQALACFWTRVVPPEGSRVRVMPDACSDLIWREGYGAFIAGPDTGAWVSSAPPGSVLVGARFLPGAGGPALAHPLSDLLNTRAPLEEVLPALQARLDPSLDPYDALRRVADSAARLALARPPDPAVREASRLLANPATRVDGLATELGLSERQLRRRFHAAVGYGPKTLQRVLRFRRFLARADGGELAQAAFDAGYADQAHLTRECVRLAGVTPARLVS
jgi:methylphosphotriester-DNA--protein-cysteine methyltransferase